MRHLAAVGNLSLRQVNTTYGQFARRVRRELGLPSEGLELWTIATWPEEPIDVAAEFAFRMRPEFAAALLRAGLAGPKASADEKHIGAAGRNLQHEGARRLLSIIKDAWADDRLLTYESAAVELGRNKDHARTVAQMCDLLDAAAAFARVPLIALIVVREKSGHINRKAWTNETWAGNGNSAEIKEQIVARSKSWKFSEDDFRAIEDGLEALSGLGNRAAWAKVRREVSDDELYAVIAAIANEQGSDAIDDLGSDTPGKTAVSVMRYARDPQIRTEVEKRARGNCELCGKPGFEKPDGTKYVETHHIIALANEGADRMANVIGLCPEHHREAHYGARQGELEAEMVMLLKALLKN